jgi:hypothetical protein
MTGSFSRVGFGFNKSLLLWGNSRLDPKKLLEIYVNCKKRLLKQKV